MKRRYGLMLFTAMVFGIRADAQTAPGYPKIAGYVGILHPLITFDNNRTVKNFDGFYVGGLPTGINIWKSPRVGFSAEFVPFIRADSSGSKMNNFLFHPGILLALGKGWTFAGRLAFETAGRYGFTPVINKIVKRNKNSGYFIAIPLPARVGNDHPASMGIGFQFGIIFQKIVMKWITRARPKIDRIACAWLIKKFVDTKAVFLFVPKEAVFEQAEQLDAIPYDIPGAEYTHYGEGCTFDYIIKKHALSDPTVLQIAPIIRAADIDRLDLAPQAAGLWAISAGFRLIMPTTMTCWRSA